VIKTGFITSTEKGPKGSFEIHTVKLAKNIIAEWMLQKASLWGPHATGLRSQEIAQRRPKKTLHICVD
jgi:hypothetical protein